MKKENKQRQNEDHFNIASLNIFRRQNDDKRQKKIEKKNRNFIWNLLRSGTHRNSISFDDKTSTKTTENSLRFSIDWKELISIETYSNGIKYWLKQSTGVLLLLVFTHTTSDERFASISSILCTWPSNVDIIFFFYALQKQHEREII